MVKINIRSLLYAPVAGAIVWFFLWFAYDIMELSRLLSSVTFMNLDLAVSLTVFVILFHALGGIERSKKRYRKSAK